MKNTGLILSILLLSLIAQAQPAAGNFKEYILWNDTLKLAWKDFKAVAVPNASEAAMTASSMEFSYNTKNTQLFWQVKVKFFPALSWFDKKRQSDYILKHEQLHFNITELYARLLRKQLSENVSSASDIQKLRKINKSILQDWQKEQNRYDAETNHSINEVKQAEWNLNIQKRLDSLRVFASK